MVEGTRESAVRRARRLEYATVGWNVLEGLGALLAGAAAGSVSLVGFGLDSFIEVTSAATLLWRFGRDRDPAARERAERRALRIVGGCFLALSVWVAVEAVRSLAAGVGPERSVPGIVVAALALVVMPLLGRAKRRVAAELDSSALRADSRQADFCAWLSAILLTGLLLHAVAGWWWADAAGGLAMAPIIAREGIEGLRARRCCSGCCNG